MGVACPAMRSLLGRTAAISVAALTVFVGVTAAGAGADSTPDVECAPVESSKPLLPDEIVVETPTERRLSMIAFRESPSHVVKFCPPPRLMFAETMLRPLVTTRS